MGFSGGVDIKIGGAITTLCLSGTACARFAWNCFLFRKPNSARVWWGAINETIYTSDNPESVTTVGNWVKSLVKRSFGNRTANNYSLLHSCNADFVMIPRTEMQSSARASARKIAMRARARSVFAAFKTHTPWKLKVITALINVRAGNAPRSHILLCWLHDSKGFLSLGD